MEHYCPAGRSSHSPVVVVELDVNRVSVGLRIHHSPVHPLAFFWVDPALLPSRVVPSCAVLAAISQTQLIKVHVEAEEGCLVVKR